MTYQLGDSLGGLVLIITVLIILILVGRIIYLGVRRRSVIKPLIKISGIIIIYLLALIGASLFSKDRNIPMGSVECFDDWCASVLSVNKVDKFIVVEVKVENQAKRSDQTPDHPKLRLVDNSGKIYLPSSESSALPGSLGGEQRALDSRIQAGESFTTKIVFDLPPDPDQVKVLLTEGSGPPIIGDQNSPLHKKTYFSF